MPQNFTDLFNTALTNLTATLTAVTGLQVVNDPRNLVPPCAFIDAPSFEAFNANVVKMLFPVRVITLGPGNLDALRQLLDLTSSLILKNVAVMSASPKVVTVGGAEYAGYELIIPIQAQNG